MNPERSKRPQPRSIDGFRRDSASPPRIAPHHMTPSTPPRPLSPQPPVAHPPLESIDITTGAEIHREDTPPKRSSRKKRIWISVAGVAGLLIVAAAAAYGWYRYEISPLDGSDTKQQSFVIKAGATPHQISDSLEQQHLVRSATAFYVYLVITHQRDTLQAGSYMIAPSKSVADIVHKLTHGAVSNFSVTFYPGGTLAGTERSEPKYSVTAQLKNAGFSVDDIRTALAAQYTQPTLFSGKPAKSSLEGYLYGDTYSFSAGTPARDVIKRSLDEFSSVATKNNLTTLYKKQHLTLYQGITLASIVQRELDEGDGSSGPTKDQQKVAQVFLLRLKKHMTLGSDVTYYYAAEQLGVTPSPDVDSPYNTRKYPGLPPGPIATPGLNALLAVAHPAQTDYLYFLSGDDGKVYFSKTDDGHQKNIQNHCQKSCQN